MPLSTKLDDKLEGVYNFKSWKYRIGLILEENDLLNRLRGGKYFSKIDLKSGYHQVPIEQKNVWKTNSL